MAGQRGFVGSAFADIADPLLGWECWGLFYIAELGILVVPKSFCHTKGEVFCPAALFTAKIWAEPENQV